MVLKISAKEVACLRFWWVNSVIYLGEVCYLSAVVSNLSSCSRENIKFLEVRDGTKASVNRLLMAFERRQFV